MSEYNFRIANTCSTCKWSRFGAGDYRWGGKKQGGVCTRLQEEVVRPKKLRFDYVYNHKEMTAQSVAGCVARAKGYIEYEIKRLTPDVVKATWVAERTKYSYPEDSLQRNLEYAVRRTKRMYKLLERLPELEANLQEWATYNKKIAAVKAAGDGFLVHRQTVCDFWEAGPGQRESVAKKIVEKHHAN